MIFTIFEGTSEIQRMLIGRTVTGLTFASLNCGYTHHVPGRLGRLTGERRSRPRPVYLNRAR